MTDDDDRRADKTQTDQKDQKLGVPLVAQPAFHPDANSRAEQEKSERQKRVRAIAIRRVRERRKRTLKFWVELVAALATVVIAALTVAYVHYSSKQWGTMQQQLELSQRAWLYPEDGESTLINFKVSATPELSMILSNSGNAPAFNLRILSDSCVVGFPLPKDYQLPMTMAQENSDTSPVYPHGKSVVQQDIYLTDDSLRSIKSGAKAFAIYGKIRYQDGVDKTIRTLPYCFIVPPSVQAPAPGGSIKLFVNYCTNHVPGDPEDVP